MTNTLLDRLHHWRMECFGTQDADALMKEAADEIERLEQEVARLRSEFSDPPADVQEAVLRKLNLWPPPKPAVEPNGECMTDQWIPMTERMPPATGDGVLVYSRNKRVTIETGWHINMLAQAAIKDDDSCFYTHWMPLPAAPSGQPEKPRSPTPQRFFDPSGQDSGEQR